jgi:hypothetical protein
MALLALHEDEGVVTMWALQVAAGRVPYRDFVVYTAPTTAYLYGAAFRLFGSSLFLDRVLDGVPMVFSTVFLALLARRFLPAAWAAAVVLLWGIWLPAFIGYGAYHFWGPAFIVVMAWALLRPEPRLVLAGAAAAAALLFYQGVAPAVLAGLLVAFLARRRLRDALAMAAGPTLAGLLLGASLLISGNLASFFDQTIGFTFGRYQDFNRLPFPANPLLLADTVNWHLGVARFWAFPMFWLLAVVVPFVVAGYALYALVMAIRSGEALSPAAALAVVSTGLLASAFVARVGGPICWLHAPLALVLVAVRLRPLTSNPSTSRRLAVVAPTLLLFVTGLSPAPVGYWMSCTTNPGGPLTTAVDTAAGRVCLRVDEAIQFRFVGNMLGRLGTPVVFLPDAPALYQLTASPPLVPSYWVLPRHTRPSEVAWMEAAMLRMNTAVYVDDSNLDKGHPWSFDDFLAANFGVVDRSPGVAVYSRKAQAP